MANGRWTLQPALSHKQRLEDICQMELAKVEVAHARERRMLEQLMAVECQAYEALRRQHMLTELDLGMIDRSFAELRALQRRIEWQLVVLQDLAETVRQRREELLEVTKEKKALEKLKEKHERELAHAMALAEEKAMQDIATTQYHRRKLAEGEAVA